METILWALSPEEEAQDLELQVQGKQETPHPSDSSATGNALGDVGDSGGVAADQEGDLVVCSSEGWGREAQSCQTRPTQLGR